MKNIKYVVVGGGGGNQQNNKRHGNLVMIGLIAIHFLKCTASMSYTDAHLFYIVTIYHIA